MKKFTILLTVLLAFSMIQAKEKTGDPEGKSTEKKVNEVPYGCYKSYKWGMNKEEVEKILGVKIKKRKLLEATGWGKDLFTPKISANHYEKTGDTSYDISYRIGGKGLYEIQLNPYLSRPDTNKKRSGQSLSQPGISLSSSILIDSYVKEYQKIRSTLTKKFGPPVKTSGDEQLEGNYFSLIEGIGLNVTVLKSRWETKESIIILTVEFESAVAGSGGVISPMPVPGTIFLVYTKKEL